MHLRASNFWTKDDLTMAEDRSQNEIEIEKKTTIKNCLQKRMKTSVLLYAV
jgi:hypothetical protein